MAQDKKSAIGQGQQTDDLDDMPLPPSVVALKAAVYLMGLILVAGFAFLVYVLVSRVSEPPIAGGNAMQLVADIELRAGESIKSVSLDRNLVTLHVTGSDGGNIIVVHDLNKGQTVRRIEIRTRPAN